MARSASPKKPAAKKPAKAKRSSTPASASKAAKKPAGTTAKKPKSAKKRKPAAKGDEEVTVDRRRVERRESAPVEKASEAETPKLERREKVNRRRQIDPTTCERDYSDAEVEFMNALDEYKRKNGRMFPTCSEVLEVIRDLGYVQLTAAERSAREVSEPVADAEAAEDAQAESAVEAALELSDAVRLEEANA